MYYFALIGNSMSTRSIQDEDDEDDENDVPIVPNPWFQPV